MNEGVHLSDGARGYERRDALQEEFGSAATRLLEADGWANPSRGGARELRADRALEGGGVKGIALVGAVMVLDEAGYRFHRVAGTSAGDVTASVIAGIVKAGHDMTTLLAALRSLDFRKFMPDGRLHDVMGRTAGHFASIVADAAILTNREGIYSSAYLEDWLRPILHEQYGVRTFADLRLTSVDDPEITPEGASQYRLVVFTSDLTRSRLTRLPWDYSSYGVDPEVQDPVQAVRASMSVPFFFEPVRFQSRGASMDVLVSGGAITRVNVPSGAHTWVDGGLLTKFPIHTFDRSDGHEPRWPTIGVKLSQFRTDYPASTFRESAIAIAARRLKTMMNEPDVASAHELSAGRTIFVDNSGLSSMDFDLTTRQQEELFLNGVRAATEFVIEAARRGGVPRR